MKILFIILSFSVLNAIGIITGCAYLPQTVPSHVNYNSIVDGLGSPWILIIFAILPFLCAGGLFLEMKLRKKDYPNKKMLAVLLLFVSLFLMYIGWIVFCLFATGAGIGDTVNIPFSALVLIPVGALFVAMGFIVPNIKQQNLTFGYRTPWTLKNKVVWQKTHKIAGRYMIAAGLIVIIGAVIDIFVFFEWFSLIILSVAIVIILIPAFYSKIIYNKEIRNSEQQNPK